MKWIVTGIALFVSVVSSAQIEIVQYSAEFVKSNEISLKSFRYDTKTLYMSKAQDKRDYADASNNDYAYKNADHDEFFAYVFIIVQ